MNGKELNRVENAIYSESRLVDAPDHPMAPICPDSECRQVQNADNNRNNNNFVMVEKPIEEEVEAIPIYEDSYGKRRRDFLCVLLIFLNFVNYMDRNSVSAVLDHVQKYFDVNDTAAGFIRLVFIITFMVFVIVFGYLGDRSNRLVLITFGLTIWASVVFIATFLPRDMFPIFVLLRTLVGVGEASFTTVAPAIITDLYVGKTRSILLAMFGLMIPAGAGVGYMVYGLLAQLSGRWQTGFYVTPTLILFGLIFLWTCIRKDPPRGKADLASGGQQSMATSMAGLSDSDFWVDINHIKSKKTFILLSFGNALQLFAVGSVIYWTPNFIERSPVFLSNGWKMGDGPKCFGIVTLVGGIVGIFIGTFTSYVIKARNEKKHSSSVTGDAYICAASSFFSVPLFYSATVVAEYHVEICFFLTFLCVVAITTNMSVVIDASLYVIHPRCRALATGINLFITKAMGEAWSSFVIGVISDACKRGRPADDCWSTFYCLQYALFTNCFVLVFAGFVTLGASWFIDADKKDIDDQFQSHDKRTPSLEEKVTPPSTPLPVLVRTTPPPTPHAPSSPRLNANTNNNAEQASLDSFDPSPDTRSVDRVGSNSPPLPQPPPPPPPLTYAQVLMRSEQQRTENHLEDESRTVR